MLRAMRGAALVLTAVLTLAADVALAQTAPPIDRTASREARKRQQDAQIEFNRRNATVKAIESRIRSAFEQRDEWIKGQADLKAAQAALEAAKKPVLAKLTAKPEYKKAIEAREKADAERESLRNSRATDKLYAAAQKAIDANFAVVQLENEALAADPNVQQAQKQLSAAESLVSALNQQLQQELETNAEWVEAKKLAEEQQLLLAQATKDMQDATKREADQIRSQQESARQQRRSSSSSRGGRSY